ncbi:MAG: SPFH domain-containing protein [Alistipes sp.]|nr:SPFH domain-containing protein [Alistipes sp.]
MGIFSRKKDTTPKRKWTSVIKNASISGDMIWRHTEEDFNTCSTLIVQPGEEAIFVKNGVIEQVFTNGTYTLKTENYPFLQRLIRMFSDGDSTFNCIIYFVRVASSIEVPWGTDSPIQVRDKELGVTTNVVARGAYKIQVGDASRFLTKMIGNRINSFAPTEIRDYFRHEFLSYIKGSLAKAINSLNGEVLDIMNYQNEIGDVVSHDIRTSLDEYGIELLKFSISAIEVMESEHRREYDDIAIEAARKIRNAKADRRVMEELGGNWQAQQQVDILKSITNNPDGGMSSTAADIGVGIAAASTIFGMGQQMISQQQQQTPPPPVSQWYLFINGQQVGPVAINQIQQYIAQGGFTRTDLVWKAGFQSWIVAESVPEIAQLFAAVPPTPPTPPTPPQI